MLAFISLILFSACTIGDNTHYTGSDSSSSIVADSNAIGPAEPLAWEDPGEQVPATINTGSTRPSELMEYARSLIGIPYKYASSDPKQGFDCSGFITNVFNRFSIAVPRSSVQFTNVQREIPLRIAKPGDLILFTGTDSTIRVVGHMGIITTRPDEPTAFIHSTSGKAYGVTITPLNPYYQGRFVKVVRIFKQNDTK